jgi:hypothetical protein
MTFRRILTILIMSFYPVLHVAAQSVEPKFFDIKLGRKIRFYVYDLTAQPLIFRPLTAEERLWIWGIKPTEIKDPADFTAECSYDPPLPSTTPRCNVAPAGGYEHPLLVFAQRLFDDYRPQLPVPNFDTANKKNNSVYQVKYSFTVNPKDYPFVYPKDDPDYTSLTDVSLFGKWKLQIESEHPEAAILTKISGNLTFRCRVKGDLSLDCYATAFYPLQQDAIFRSFASRIGVGQKAPATLTTGQSSVGVQFQKTIRFRVY